MGVVALPVHGRAQDAAGSCGDATAAYAQVQVESWPRLDLELARTAQEHEVGLMFREALPPDTGMLFIYQAESREAYWMYNTLIPLSIAWIDRDGTIVDIQDMPRLNDPSNRQEAAQHTYPAAAPYWNALEVNQGWFAGHGIGVGQQILFCLGA